MQTNLFQSLQRSDRFWHKFDIVLIEKNSLKSNQFFETILSNVHDIILSHTQRIKFREWSNSFRNIYKIIIIKWKGT